MWEHTIFGFTVYQLFWYFCVYAVIGWCTEVVFCTVNTGKWVNRGFLNGPVCPIYGFGVLIVLCVLTPLKEHFLVLFLGAAILTSLLELVTGYVLEKSFHTHWWDYSNMPFNIGGYVCLKFSIIWGLCCVLVVRVVHPFIASFVALMPIFVGKILAVPVAGIFLADLIVTATSISKMNRDLGELEKIAEALRRQSDLVSHTLGDTALDISARFEDAKSDLGEKLGDARIDLSVARAELADKLGDAKSSLSEKARAAAGKAQGGYEEALRRRDELQAKYDRLSKKQWTARRLTRAFPTMRHTGAHTEAFEALREKFGKK